MSANVRHLLCIQAGEGVGSAQAGGRQEGEPAAVLLRHERQLLLQPRVLLGQTLVACRAHTVPSDTVVRTMDDRAPTMLACGMLNRHLVMSQHYGTRAPQHREYTPLEARQFAGAPRAC